MTGWWTKRRDLRRRNDENWVLTAIRMLRPSHASGYPIARLAGIGAGRVYPALVRLEADGRVLSAWEQPSPFLASRARRRLYRINGAVITRVGAGQ